MGGIRLVGQGKRPQLIPILGYSVAQGLVPARHLPAMLRNARWAGCSRAGEAGGSASPQARRAGIMRGPGKRVRVSEIFL